MEKKRTNNEEALEAQVRLCKTRNYPFFIPSNGICYFCGKDIFGERGYSVERASKELLTGCPCCHRSYCD